MSNLCVGRGGTFIPPNNSFGDIYSTSGFYLLLVSIGIYIIYLIDNNYLKLVVLSFEDDIKHTDMESNSAANKVYKVYNTWKNIISSGKRKTMETS